jgi:DNA polymerase-3 subunit delta'
VSEFKKNNLHPWLVNSFKELTSRPLPQALLIHGASNIGKLEFGLALANFVLCENSKKSDYACGECDACHWFSAGNHPDFVPVLPEELESLLNFSRLDVENSKTQSNLTEDKKLSKVIKIEQIRDAISSIEIGAHRGSSKIVLIYPVEAMQSAAANSLLKSLEEPPNNVKIILISHQIDKVLPTIKSRCRLIPIGPPSFEQGLEWLKMKLDGASVSAEKIESVFRENGGAVLKSLDQLQMNGQTFASEIVLGYLMNPQQLNQSNFSELISKVTMKDLIFILQKWILDLTLLLNKLPPKFYPSQISVLNKYLKTISIEKLLIYSNKLTVAQKYSEHPLNNKIQAEHLLVEYLKLFK